VAATDYVKLFAEQIRGFVPRRYSVLGTDGFGRSDTREDLRRFFEVDRGHIVLAALRALQQEEQVAAELVTRAIAKYEIDVARRDPARA
jgi:pyruvate dehydrogenase E1 component